MIPAKEYLLFMRKSRHSPFVSNRLQEPRFGVSPMTLSSPHRNLKRLRRLLHGQSCEIPERDKVSQFGTLDRQLSQCFVDGQQIGTITWARNLLDIQQLSLPIAPTFQRLLPPSAFHQDSPHRLGCGRIKVPKMVPSELGVLVYQPHVSFVHQGGWLQRIPGCFAAQLAGCQATQLIIHQRQQLLRRLRLARFDLRQNTGDVRHREELGDEVFFEEPFFFEPNYSCGQRGYLDFLPRRPQPVNGPESTCHGKTIHERPALKTEADRDWEKVARRLSIPLESASASVRTLHCQSWAETRLGYLIVPGTIMSFPTDIESRAADGSLSGSTLRRWFETALSYLVPAAMQSDPQQRLQARRVAAFGLAVTCWAPLFAPLYWALGSTRSAWMIVGAAATIMLSTQSLRWFRNTYLAGNLVAGSLFSVLISLATVTGGIQATSLSWLPAVAIIGLLLCDTRSGIAWGVVCCLACGVMLCLPEMGVTLANDIAPQSQWILESSGTSGIVLCALTLTYLFQSSEMKMRRELATACDQSEQANRAKSTFLANMSHEIRTPLNAVLGMADLMLDTPLSRQQQEYLAIAQDSGQSLLAVVDDILDFSRIESGRLVLAHERFDLHDILLRTLKALAIPAHRKGLELSCHIQPNVPRHVVGDASRLRQIVINLVGNGIKFTDEGEVLLRVGLEQQTAGTVVLNFVTSDTGIGVPAERQEVIFQMFEQADNSTTRRFGGFGLGLAITSHLVQAMGGKITVTSEVGHGSTFAFSATFGRTPQEDPPRTETLAGQRVLVVEDQPTARQVVEQMLSSLRMQAVFVSEVSEAWELIEQAESGRSLFDYALIDCLLGRDSGYELAERIQQTSDGRVRVVMMLTTDQLPVSLAWCERIGIQAYLLKPISQEDLLKTLMNEASSDTRTVSAPDHIAPLMPVGAPRSLRVLVAEDSLVNQKLVVGLLNKLGHQAVLATNGREAVAATESQPIDLILMDIQMPEMDGLEATRIIRERERRTGAHLPIIAVTAHVLPEDREKCRAAGMDDYVSKPIRFQTLAAAIERLLPLSASPETDET